MANMLDFTVEDGLDMQADDLKRWEPRLSAACYNALATFLADHRKAHDYFTGYDVPRGQDLTSFIICWPWK